MYGALYYNGKDVNLNSLEEFLKKNNVDTGLRNHYLARFKSEKGEGDISRYDFRHWAERAQYTSRGGVTHDDAKGLWDNLISKA